MNVSAQTNSLPRLALLAGGLATRLQPFTLKKPKSMVEVAGKPFISHQLRQLEEQGIEEVVICCGHLGEQIKDFVKDGSSFGLSVRYSDDGDRPRGTGGALKHALPMLGSSFLVMYGDSYLTVSIASVWKVFQQSGKPALMTVFRNHDQWDTSNVEYLGGRILRYDKQRHSARMQHIDYGLGILNASVFNAWLASKAFDLSSVYSALQAKDQLAGFEVAQRFYEIGSHTGLREMNMLFAKESLGLGSHAPDGVFEVQA
jgi:NDP-sugar pyrophosphorylase family protein